jgi:hypothetical protein
MPTEKKLPDAEGWWARNREGRVDWFYVHVFSDAPIGIWLNDIHSHRPVTEFSHPLTRWYGPVELPWPDS